MGSQNHRHDQIHCLLIPLMSQSRLIPYTDMAKLLAGHGLTVSIITTPVNALRFKPIVDNALNSNLKIHLLPLPFPCKEAGLPEGCENMDSIPSPDLVTPFFKAASMLQKPLEKLLATRELRPTCIISECCLPWTADVATKFNIPRYVFHAISCFTLLCSHNLLKVHNTATSDSESFFVPGMPDKIQLTKNQLPGVMKRRVDGLGDFLDRMRETELSSQGLLVNSFEELEPEYVKGYRKVAKNIWCIGPVSLSNKEVSDKYERGNKSSINENQCLEWLNSMKPSSVIYVCFGSLCHLSPSQLIEIGLGLEASNRPFIWIIRKADDSPEIEKWLAQERFQKRVQGRGLIIRGWAPQVLILSHPAIGGFLTHCGWNSTLEGVCAGVPMITWPMFAEQFYNEKLVVQMLRTGVRIGVEVSMEWGEEEKGGGLVKREKIVKAIEEVMDEGEEGLERRKRARELGEMANKAIEGGSSHLNMTLFIQDIMRKQVTHEMPTQENGASLLIRELAIV
ncbi:hypothetical protein L1049_001421 [Liquidambar formosana]|uniref:Glycosyltransferase n=1 Tax=Liquidambar formosana TaxID=63359 RepID=A0AAP0NEP2_LIQFO